MNYNLAKSEGKAGVSFFTSLLADEKQPLIIASIAIIINAILNLLAPFLMGYAIDAHVITGEFQELWKIAGLLVLIFVGAFIAAYIQTISMGGVGQRLLYKLRNKLFAKIEELPVAFFQENKAGDLISRINNDTDKLNQFFSQSIMQFVGNAFMLIGAGIALLLVNAQLGAWALLPAVCAGVFTQLSGNWVKKKNGESLKTMGNLSAAVQEGLENFKVIVAFNRRDLFQEKINSENAKNFQSAIWAGIANNILTPVYTFTGNVAQVITITYGITLIAAGNFSVGLLISFLSYVTRFYDPLRQIAAFWASWQSARAAANRIQSILMLTSNMEIVKEKNETATPSKNILEFNRVHFSYANNNPILEDISFSCEEGKTYALVGPTGGGKTTTASLIARLYDVTQGSIFLKGKNIKTYTHEDRTKSIGFILQDPIIFEGTLLENLAYANEALKNISEEEMTKLLKEKNLLPLIQRFSDGLKTSISAKNNSISAGQKQIIAFARAILREPELLILDEASANIDTVTENLLQDALNSLPQSTTKIIIAHRLNTIANADEIFFVGGGKITPAGTLENAIKLLQEKTRKS